MRQTAWVNYHLKKNERQAFHFDVDGVVGNLKSPELVATEVAVEDLRDRNMSVNFDNQGIAFERHVSAISDFAATPDWQNTYNAELKTLLQTKIGAKEVIVFDHTIRVDDPNADRKPARNVHTDYSEAGALRRLVDLVGEDMAADYLQGHFAYVNVWRPVEHVITSSPLGFIHPKTIDTQDWITIDLIYPERVGEILGVAANEQHAWFYLSGMTPNDVVIFTIYDNAKHAFIGHSALDMTAPGSHADVRKSIESRTLVRYR